MESLRTLIVLILKIKRWWVLKEKILSMDVSLRKNYVVTVNILFLGVIKGTNRNFVKTNYIVLDLRFEQGVSNEERYI